MKKTTILYLVSVLLLFSGCQALEKQQQYGAAVDVNGHFLFRSTLDSLTVGLNSDDSLRVVQQYISAWAKDILMYDAVKNGQLNVEIDAIEQMVADYRHSLYVHAYESYLVERFMSKAVPDSTIEQMYAQLSDRFRLDESIMKGILVIVPNDAPNINKLRKWMTNESLDDIEKYVYQNASGYELFADRWVTTTDMLAQIPVERKELENKLKTKNQIEVSDSLKTYLLQVTDKYLLGNPMPLEYARPEIEKIILSERQVDFLLKEREKLYNEAIQEQKIRFYEN